jgi:hypothetical protein
MEHVNGMFQKVYLLSLLEGGAVTPMEADSAGDIYATKKATYPG